MAGADCVECVGLIVMCALDELALALGRAVGAAAAAARVAERVCRINSFWLVSEATGRIGEQANDRTDKLAGRAGKQAGRGGKPAGRVSGLWGGEPEGTSSA